MSKKTEAMKRKRAMTKRPRNADKRRGKRPNPAFNVGIPPIAWTPSQDPFRDPIFLHHALGALSRFCELHIPNFNLATIDAEFLDDPTQPPQPKKEPTQ